MHISEISIGYHSLTACYDSLLLLRLAKRIRRIPDLLSFSQILRLPFVFPLALLQGSGRLPSELLVFPTFMRTAFNEHADDCICYLRVLESSTLETEGIMLDRQRALRLWPELIALSELFFVTHVRGV